MTFADHFSGHAALYCRARPTYPFSLIAELAELSPARRQAWDVGTGNGQSARMLADHFDAVSATDASAGQISEAAPHPRIRFAVERAEHCSLPDESCELVLAAQCIHWFDHPKFFGEVTRILRPNGLLAAIGYGWFYVDERVDEIVGRSILKPLEPLWAAENWLLVDGYRSLDFPGEEVRLTPAAIHLDWTREQVEAYVRSWSAVQRLGEDVVEEGFAELARVWPNDQSRRVTMPILSRAARL